MFIKLTNVQIRREDPTTIIHVRASKIVVINYEEDHKATQIQLSNGDSYLVLESPDAVLEAIKLKERESWL